ncbi:7 transmembrane receptor (rhodopsin family) domain-containing protein [Ditylenchus destructor]|nr:7 transmembrane receptor (rhodopsin family) domain-containing protein [Ditylenchus destructor]
MTWTVMTDKEFTWPTFTCPLLIYASRSFFYQPIFSYLAIAIERYTSIVRNHTIKFLPAIVVNVSVWLAAFIVSIPYYLSHEVDSPSCTESPKKCVKDANRDLWTVYAGAEALISYFVPLGICVALYICIWRFFRRQNEVLQQTMATIISPSLLYGAIAQMEIRRGVMKLCITVTAIFFLSYTPVAVSIIATMFNGLPEGWLYVERVLLQLALSVNPLIYSRLSTSYRQQMRSLKGALWKKLQLILPNKCRQVSQSAEIELSEVS